MLKRVIIALVLCMSEISSADEIICESILEDIAKVAVTPSHAIDGLKVEVQLPKFYESMMFHSLILNINPETETGNRTGLETDLGVKEANGWVIEVSDGTGPIVKVTVTVPVAAAAMMPDASISVAEEHSVQADKLVFTLERTGNLEASLEVMVAVSSAEGYGYVLTSGMETVTFAAGASEARLELPRSPLNTVGPGETITVTIQASASASYSVVQNEDSRSVALIDSQPSFGFKSEGGLTVADSKVTVNLVRQGSNMGQTSVMVAVTSPNGYVQLPAGGMTAVQFAEGAMAASLDLVRNPLLTGGDLVTVTIVNDLADYRVAGNHIGRINLQDPIPVIALTRLTADAGSVEAAMRRTGSQVALQVKVLVTSPHNYVETGMMDHSFPMGETDTKLTLPILRLLGPGETITVTLQGSANYDLASQRSASVMLGGNDVVVRNQQVKTALTGLGRSLGWDLAEAISQRSSSMKQGQANDLAGLRQHLIAGLSSRYGMGTGQSSIMDIIETLNGKSDPLGARGNLPDVNVHGLASSLPDVSGHQLGSMDYRLGENSHQAWNSNPRVNGYNHQPSLDNIHYPQGASSYGTGLESGADASDPGLAFWGNVKRSNLEFGGGASAKYDGNLTSVNLGVDQVTFAKMVVGFTLSSWRGELGFSHHGLNNLSGELELKLWSLAPYLVWSSDRVRVWGSLGLGKGDMDYQDTYSYAGTTESSSESSKVNMTMVATGADIQLADRGRMEVLGRVQSMLLQLRSDEASTGLYHKQGVDVSGVRGEVELGWPRARQASSSLVRPYLTLGFRYDGGESHGGTAVEYGAGLQMQMTHFTLDGLVRSQSLGRSDEFDKASYSLSFSYDSDSDRQGLMLKLGQEYGVDEMDPFSPSFLALMNESVSMRAQGTGLQYAGSSRDHGYIADNAYNNMRDNFNIEAGYGMALDKPLLTIQSSTQFSQGVMNTTELGLTIQSETRTCRTCELLYRHRAAPFIVQSILFRFFKDL